MVVIVMGVSGSGKTTVGSLLARRLGWSFYDADDFHPPANKEKMTRGIPLSDEDRVDWLSSLRHSVEREIVSNHSAVFACSALKEVYRERLQVTDQVKFVFLRGTYEQIETRMNERAHHFMKPNMLRSQFEILEEPADVISVDITAPPDEIVKSICKELNL